MNTCFVGVHPNHTPLKYKHSIKINIQIMLAYLNYAMPKMDCRVTPNTSQECRGSKCFVRFMLLGAYIITSFISNGVDHT